MTVLAAFPVDDWQFWAVTALAIGAVWLVAAPFLPKRGKKSSSCPGCPSGNAAEKAPREKRVDLTIAGKRVKP